MFSRAKKRPHSTKHVTLAIDLSAAEYQRIAQVAHAQGVSVEVFLQRTVTEITKKAEIKPS